MPDVGQEDQPRRLLVGAAAEPDEVRRRAAGLEVRVAARLVLVPVADQQQHQLRHALGDLAQQLPVGAVAEVARARRRRPSRPASGAGKESAASGTSSGLAALLAGEVAERVGDDDGHRRPQRRGQVQLLQPVALARRGVVGDLVAVPAPVPELGVGVLGDQAAGERVLERVEDHDRARDAGQPQPARLGRGEPVGDRRRAAAGRRRRARARARRRRRPGALSRSSAWSRRMKRLELAREQQDADRRRLVTGRARDPLGDAAERVGRAARTPSEAASRDRSCRVQTLASPARDDELPATAAARPARRTSSPTRSRRWSRSRCCRSTRATSRAPTTARRS